MCEFLANYVRTDRRQAFLKAHLQTQASGMRLKARVDAALQLVRQPAAATPLPQAAIHAAAAGQAVLTELAPPFHEWLESLPPEHLFGEYLHLIGSLLREIHAEELQATELNRIAELAEPLIYLNTLYKLQHASAPEETSQAVPHRFFI